MNGFHGDCFNETGSGSGYLDANVDAAGCTFTAGSGWHKLEMYNKVSTTATSQDGVIRWWADGHQCGEYTNINYSPGGLDNIQINHAWDGGHVRDMSKSWHHYWDHWRVSIPNGG